MDISVRTCGIESSFPPYFDSEICTKGSNNIKTMIDKLQNNTHIYAVPPMAEPNDSAELSFTGFYKQTDKHLLVTNDTRRKILRDYHKPDVSTDVFFNNMHIAYLIPFKYIPNWMHRVVTDQINIKATSVFLSISYEDPLNSVKSLSDLIHRIDVEDNGNSVLKLTANFLQANYCLNRRPAVYFNGGTVYIEVPIFRTNSDYLTIYVEFTQPKGATLVSSHINVPQNFHLSPPFKSVNFNGSELFRTSKPHFSRSSKIEQCPPHLTHDIYIDLSRPVNLIIVYYYPENDSGHHHKDLISSASISLDIKSQPLWYPDNTVFSKQSNILLFTFPSGLDPHFDPYRFNFYTHTSVIVDIYLVTL